MCDEIIQFQPDNRGPDSRAISFALRAVPAVPLQPEASPLHRLGAGLQRRLQHAEILRMEDPDRRRQASMSYRQGTILN